VPLPANPMPPPRLLPGPLLKEIVLRDTVSEPFAWMPDPWAVPMV
jgi:hypothetical protein